ncbi:MAG: hypothetical protein WD156_07165 [Acidimicrobiia bacterium]
MRFLPLALVAVLALPAIPASADAVDSAVNGTRATPLPSRGELEAVANSSAASQASRGQLAHTSLSGVTSVCLAAGEIVGAGASIAPIFELFLQSATHRPLLLSSNWTAMGTGSATGADGKIYVSVVFCTETNPSSAAVAPPPPPPSSNPAPVTSNQPATTRGSAPIQAVTPVTPITVAVPSFDDVFYRLFTGDLHEQWIVLTGPSNGLPMIGPSLFVSPVFWTISVGPTIS